MSKKLEIDACIGSELRDTQGETLSVEGADISELESGNGRWNDNHGKGFFNSLGRVTNARKIMSESDITNDREQYYWDKVKSPYIYAKGYLYNDEDDHQNAKAAAAILKNIHKTDAPLRIKASVEGGVVSRGIKDSSYLARTKIHSVALTFTPANTATLVEPMHLMKSDTTKEDDALIKFASSMAQNDVPSFIDISNSIRMKKIESNVLEINRLIKEEKKYFPSLSTGSIEAKQDKKVQDRATQKPTSADPIVNLTDRPKVTPASSETVPILSSQQHKNKLTVKSHALKAIKDSTHLGNIRNDLVTSGAEKERVNNVVNTVKDHMLEHHTNMSMDAHIDTVNKIEDVEGRKKYLKQMMTRLHNGKADKELKDHFVQNFVNGYNKKKKMNKAMMAGYAGAGSPMNGVGGSVIQSESLEDVGFKYMTCNSCGKEQIKMSSQVKCRHCGKNFSLKKLFDSMEP